MHWTYLCTFERSEFILARPGDNHILFSRKTIAIIAKLELLGRQLSRGKYGFFASFCDSIVESDEDLDADVLYLRRVFRRLED
jgi:hypothetical protein